MWKVTQNKQRHRQQHKTAKDSPVRQTADRCQRWQQWQQLQQQQRQQPVATSAAAGHDNGSICSMSRLRQSLLALLRLCLACLSPFWHSVQRQPKNFNWNKKLFCIHCKMPIIELVALLVEAFFWRVTAAADSPSWNWRNLTVFGDFPYWNLFTFYDANNHNHIKVVLGSAYAWL